jgi:DNA-binding IclR family transcriptional regulator
MDLARVRSDHDELVISVTPHLERMRAITGETVGLHIPMGDLRLCVAELVSRQSIRTATGVGRTFPLPDGASGQVLVAWSEGRLEMVKKRLEAAGDRDRTDFDVTLKQVRENGYAMSADETISGASALAFPLFGPNKDVCAAINVTGPASRWTKTAMLSFLAALSEEVAQVSEQLGYRE